MSAELIELKKISKLLVLAHGEAVEKELSKYITTNERKKAWILIDGNSLTAEIGEKVGMKLRTIQNFLKILVDASLIENPRDEPPRKLIDYVPASWLDLMKTEPENRKQKGEETANEPNK